MPSASWLNGWVTGDVVTAAEFKKGVGCVADSTLGVAGATINVASLPTTYAHLVVLAYLRGDTAATQTACNVTVNGDSGANYDRQAGAFSAAAASSAETFAGSALFSENVAAASATSNVFTGMMIVFPNYANTSNNKAAFVLTAKKTGVTTGLLTMGATAGFWRSNSAINQITFTPAAGNFLAGSRVSVYVMGS